MKLIINMRLFLSVLVLIFSLQSWTKADDIKEFEVEGMSIGDSALDFFSSIEIDNAIDESYPDRRFLILTIYKSFGPYEIMQIVVKPNDIKYELYAIVGVIPYRKNIDECYKKMNEIVNEVSSALKNIKKIDYGRVDNPVLSDPYGGTYDLVSFEFNDGRAQVSCNDWSEKSKIIDSVKVELFSLKYDQYLDEIL